MKRHPVMVIDRDGADRILRALGDIPANVIPVRHEVYRVPPAMVAKILGEALARLLFRSKQRRGYLQLLIETLRPRVVATFIDNNMRFYELAALYSHIPFIAVQNGWRLSDRLPSAPGPGQNPAWIIGLSSFDRDAHRGKHYDLDRYIVAGSLSESLSRLSQHPAPKMDVCIVSQWRPNCQTHLPRFYAAQTAFHVHAGRYIRERGLRCVIAGWAGGEPEIDYFRSHYGDTVSFCPRGGGVGVYDLMRNADTVMTVNSTAGREALGMGKRVVFCDYPSEEQTYHDTPGLAPLYITEGDYAHFAERVDRIRGMSADEWDRLYTGTLAYFMPPSTQTDCRDTFYNLVKSFAETKTAGNIGPEPKGTK